MANKSTKNAKGAGTIRKRPDGRWEARYSLGFDPKTGRQIQRSVYGATQKEVRQKLAKITSEIDEGSYMEPSKDTLEAWLETWLKTYVAPSVKPYTLASYRGVCENFLNPALGRVKLSQLTAPQIQQMYNEILMDRGLSAKTVKNIHGVFHRAMDQAMKLGYLRLNPLNAVILPRVEKPQIEIIEDEKMKIFLDAIKGDPFEIILFVTVFTGLRQGEVLGLTWDCVNFENGTLLINKQHNRSQMDHNYQFSSVKTDRIRVLNVSKHVMDKLRQQQMIQKCWADAAGSAWNNADDLVFTNELGSFIKNKTLYMHFKRISSRIGLGNLRFHALRHTYAVNSLRAGDDIKTVQENLGHTTAAFTLGTYAHATPGMKRESAKRMDDYIELLESTPYSDVRSVTGGTK